MALLPLLIAAALVGLTLYWSVRNGISPMPSTSRAKEAILQLYPRFERATVYELGCGWGSLLVPLARAHPGHRFVGFETSPLPYWITRLRLALSCCENAEVRRLDLFSAPFEEADLLICYLYPAAMQRLAEKCNRELKEGAYVISNTFAMPSWRVQERVVLGDLYQSKVYLYRK